MGILSQDLDKTARRFVGEAVYGIMASQSVMLTDIGRQQESSISLKKIEERFSRQLIKPKIWNCLHQRILSLASSRVKDRTLLILDLSDLKKKYAEKMEHMATVRDGRELVDGYWTNQVIASEVGSNEITPLHFLCIPKLHLILLEKTTRFYHPNGWCKGCDTSGTEGQIPLVGCWMSLTL